MRKRLRKKLHKGEFQELGFELEFKVYNSMSSDIVFDKFIDFIESIDLECGGGCSHGGFNFFVTKWQIGSVTKELQEQVSDWLIENIKIDSSTIVCGKLIDAWNGWKVKR